MFSHSGNWKRGVFDGCVTMIGDGNDANNLSNSGQKLVIDGLKMPHNFQIHGDYMYVCNSLNGQVLGANNQILYQSNGFVRGLLIDGDFLIVGESRNRNFANIQSDVLNSCIDTRISIVDTESKAYRSIQLPIGVSEIHAIIKVQNKTS